MVFQAKLAKGIDYTADKQIIRDKKSFDKMIDFLGQSSLLVCDTETTGLQWYRQSCMCGIALGGITNNNIRYYYVPFRHKTGERQLHIYDIHSGIHKLLKNPNTLKIFHNIKFDEHMLRKENFVINGSRYDTLIAARLFDENRSAALKERAITDLGYTNAAIYEDRIKEELVQLAKLNKLKIAEYTAQYGYSQIPVLLCGLYACHDIEYTLHLYYFYESRNISHYPIFATEMSLTSILCDMEESGMHIDVPYLNNLKAELTSASKQIENVIWQITGGYRFNLASDEELLNFIQNILKLPLTKLTKKGKFAVDKSVLRDLAKDYPIFGLIKDWRETEKLRTTYTDSIILRLDEENILHCDYQQVGTTTGRLSCREPNLQNQPSDNNERAIKCTGKSLEDGGFDPWSIRRAYTVEKNWVRLYFDYSQIELRVLAYYTKDPVMVDAYINKQDIHDRTSLEIFGSNEKHLRRLAKIINFGLSYGMQEKGFSAQAGIPLEDASKFLNIFFDRYKGISIFKEKFWEILRQNKGYFENIFGRPHHIANINSFNKWDRIAAEREAIATLIQGTAAELTKESLVSISTNVNFNGWWELAQVVCTIHDEIQIDCHKSIAVDLAKDVKYIMENFPQFYPIPIVVDIQYTETNWREKKKWKGVIQ